MRIARGLRRLLAPAARRATERSWTPLLLLVLGLASIAVLVWADRVGDRRKDHYLTVERSLQELQLTVAVSHLWFEEYLTGDPNVDLEREVFHNQDRAVTMVRRILRELGGEGDGGSLGLRDPELRGLAEELERRVNGFRRLGHQRDSAGGAAGIGSALDESYDESFRAVMALARELERGLVDRRRHEQHRALLHLLAVVGALTVILTVAAAGLWTWDFHRRRTEDQLRERERELQRAQKMEAVGRLAGGLAHDVNNYLGAIRGHCEVAKMKGESGEALTRRLDAAIGTADKVSALIRQLLAFSRRQPVEPQVVDLNRVVGEMEALVERLLRDDVVLATDLEPGLGSVLVDPVQVEQILVNLVVNAQDAMPTGGRITLRTRNLEHDGPFLDLHPSAAPGPHVALAVADEGAGIPPELHDKIFDPFFTTKEEKGSSGLGLATVYGIVQQNGGFVTFESRVGVGTTFEVHLPACDQRPEPLTTREAEPAVRTVPARVLLVEDNEPMRVATREMLETLGHTVLVAADGDRALDRLADAEEPVGLLVTDVVMPGMSGKDLLDRIRERHGPVPCLFISGYADQTLLHRGLEEEKVNLLHKPFGLRELARKIAEILPPPG